MGSEAFPQKSLGLGLWVGQGNVDHMWIKLRVVFKTLFYRPIKPYRPLEAFACGGKRMGTTMVKRRLAFMALGGFLSAAVLGVISLAVLPAKADKCDALKPTGAQNISGEISGKIEGDISGLIKRIAGGSASIEGVYRTIVTDTLRNYPDSSKLYVWQRIIYLACINPDQKNDISELSKLYLSPPPTTVTGNICPPGMTPAPHFAAGIENDHSVIGSEYTDTQNGIYNFCSIVDQATSGLSSQSNETNSEMVYRVPTVDPSGNPCQKYIRKEEVTHSTIIGPPGFNPFGLPPGTCAAEQIITNNYGNPTINNGAKITKQKSSGNVLIQ
jgi:hypothetical protein